VVDNTFFYHVGGGVEGCMVFNIIFNSFSVILWQSVLLVEETGVNLEKTTDLW